MIGQNKQFETDRELKYYTKVRVEGKLEYWKCKDTGHIIIRKNNQVVGEMQGDTENHSQGSLAQWT